MPIDNLVELVKASGLSGFHPSTAPTMEVGAKGPHVDLLHRLLRAALPSWEGTTDYEKLVGDKYTNNTKKTLASYQAGNCLMNDGVCGYKSWMALSGIEAFKMVYEPPAGSYLTQSKKTRCWAAATATLKGLGTEIQPSPSRSYYLDQVGGILNDNPAEAWANNSANFAKDMNLSVTTTGMGLNGIIYMMWLRGRVMLNSRTLFDNNSHFYVLISARGDGTDKGTTIGFWDPYPDNNKKGTVMYRSYNWLKQQYSDVTYRVFCTLNGQGKS